MLDRYQVGPIIDYIHNQKFGIMAPQPNFCMKGRTAESLLRQTEDWHNRLAKQRPKNYVEWKSTGIQSFRKEEGSQGKPSFKIWTINEILNSKDLSEEGRSQSHCVGSYSHSCSAGRVSIWSMRVSNFQEERILTLEVNNSSRAIVQARGKCNRMPDQKSYGIFCEWAVKSGLSVNI
jgi:hypothetical protein